MKDCTIFIYSFICFQKVLFPFKTYGFQGSSNTHFSSRTENKHENVNLFFFLVKHCQRTRTSPSLGSHVHLNKINELGLPVFYLPWASSMDSCLHFPSSEEKFCFNSLLHLFCQFDEVGTTRNHISRWRHAGLIPLNLWPFSAIQFEQQVVEIPLAGRHGKWLH